MPVNEILDFLKQPTVLVGLVILLVVVMIFIVLRMVRKRKLYKRFNQLEVKYNDLVSVPISFKINKANSVAKVDKTVDSKVLAAKKDHSDLTKRHDEISNLLADVEDAIAFSKFRLGDRLLNDLDLLIEDGIKITKSLDQRLDQILSQESKQRDEITDLKDMFRKTKTNLMGNPQVYGESYEKLEEKAKEIEGLFSSFEEWMFASNFEKSQELSETIHEEIIQYRQKVEEIPDLYSMAKGTIPRLLDHVSEVYQVACGNEVYLAHLEIPKNISMLAELLKDDLTRINEAKTEDTKDSLAASKERLEQLVTSIEKEVDTHHVLSDLMGDTFTRLDDLLESISNLAGRSERIQARFGFEDLLKRVDNFSKIANALDEKRSQILEYVEEKEQPASVLVVLVREVKQDFEMLEKDFKELEAQVNQASADEIRAQQQLLKLYLIINDVEVRIKRRSLPSISDEYEMDLQRARTYTRQIQEHLNQDILEVTTLNATVSEAIDYIYKLHNNVNNLVGVVDMCENAIVYANKFRAYVPDIDSELTKAELAFNNGEYTQSLTMIINAIDRFRPNTSYEEMIKDNAKSAH